MRQYLIDEVNKQDIEKVNAYLHKNAHQSGLLGVYWIHIPDDLLDKIQYRHDACKPFRFAVEVGRDNVKIEFLIRSQKSHRCNCIKYATKIQREFITNFCENLIETLNIHT